MFRIAHCLIVLSIVTLYRLYLSNAAVSSWFVGNPGARTRRRSDTGSGLLQRLRKKTRHQSEKIGGSVATFLENIVGGSNPLEFQKGAKVFSQGERANSMYFIRSGKVKVTVASVRGKNAVLALLGPRDFFGEGCLVGGASARTSTATTLEPSAIFRIEKRAMLRAFALPASSTMRSLASRWKRTPRYARSSRTMVDFESTGCWCNSTRT